MGLIDCAVFSRQEGDRALPRNGISPSDTENGSSPAGRMIRGGIRDLREMFRRLREYVHSSDQ